ncbi:MAG TPA: RAMP superfamily CRISPR-associated protein [Candidatus Limnocylindrales bacterium]|nr:RAMP superfamily CRISPR-associated protein [Candidatus Limnocylindrales bacterium]
MRLEIHLKLKSDATFGRGDGVAGLVDEEVEYDVETGLPFLRGRTLKGLLAEECANILFALNRQNSPAYARFEQAAKFLFGQGGSTLEDDALMHVGAALLPQELRDAIEADVKSDPPRLKPAEVLESLTAIRRQTAVDEKTGAPEEGSLRSMRVVLRDTPFIARLDFDRDPDDVTKALLAACVLSLRRAGTGRNRGRGRLTARLRDEHGHDITDHCFQDFQQLVKGASS